VDHVCRLTNQALLRIIGMDVEVLGHVDKK
jgi:hypothetical protein